jgi:tetratricopeptide (TPR) repeat protein
MSDREDADTLRLMGKKPDTPLTPAIAREVCERANQQVALNGSIAALGSEYLMTLEAVDCHTGKTLASAKERVAGNGKVLDGPDSLAERVRSKLGESAQSIGKFDVPLQQTTTSSLEALRIYSIGKHIQAQANGDSEAIPLFQRAIQIDPLFATAYGELAVSYYNLSEPSPYGLDPTSILMLRGEAYLQAGKFEQAAAQYKVIVDNHGHEFDVEHPLALLGQARALRGPAMWPDRGWSMRRFWRFGRMAIRMFLC